MKQMFFYGHRGLWLVLFGVALLSLVSCHSRDRVSDAEVAALQERLDSLNREYALLREQGSDYAGELGSKDSMIQSQAAEIQSLIAQLRQARAAADAGGDAALLREKNAQISTLRKQLDAQSRQLKRLEAEAAASSGSVSPELQKQIERYKDQVARQEKQIADLGKQIDGLNNRVGTQDGTIASLQEEKAALTRRVETLNGQVNQLNAQMSSSQGDNDAQLAGCQQRVSQLESRADRLQQQVESLQGRVKACDAQQQERDRLQQQVDAMGKQVSQLQQQLQERESRLKALEGERSGSSEEAASRISALQEHVALQQEEISRLTAELQSKEKALQELQAGAGKSSQTATAATAGKKLSELQAMCENYAQEIERLRAENARLQTENDQLRDEMAQVQRDAERALTDNSKLEQKVALASILVADNLTATAAKSINGNSIKETEKASQVAGVRIEGRLLDNNVVDPGTVRLYARIASANNRIVANGTPEDFDLQGVRMQYTMSQDIEFTGASRKILMMWRKLPATEMPAGLYWVTLYAGGNEIGKTSFLLK